MNRIIELVKKFITFFKYIFSSGFCYIIDLVIFTILTYLLKNKLINSYILISTVVARVISSIINFLINKNKVFKQDIENKVKNINLMLNYFLLVILQMFVSAISTEIIYKLTKLNLTILKFLVDCVILLVNYFIQKKYIFNNKYIKFIKEVN